MYARSAVKAESTNCWRTRGRGGERTAWRQRDKREYSHTTDIFRDARFPMMSREAVQVKESETWDKLSDQDGGGG